MKMGEWWRNYFGLAYILGDNNSAFRFRKLEERVGMK